MEPRPVPVLALLGGALRSATLPDSEYEDVVAAAEELRARFARAKGELERLEGRELGRAEQAAAIEREKAALQRRGDLLRAYQEEFRGLGCSPAPAPSGAQ